MEHDSPPPQRSFLQAFFGSFVAFNEYPLFVQRSLASALGHVVLLLTLVCSLYAGLAAYGLKVGVEPYLQGALKQIPEITIKGGVASTTAAQPHIITIEGEPIFVIDTTQDPQVHLDKYNAVGVLSATQFTTKNGSGKIESHQLAGDLEFNSSVVANWLDIARAWVLPILFLGVAIWQFCWKSIQVLLVAGVVTLVNSSRPDFSTHLRLTCYALSPATAWGVGVFAAWINGITIPFAGLIFWAILLGLTASMAAKIKNSPKYH